MYAQKPFQRPYQSNQTNGTYQDADQTHSNTVPQHSFRPAVYGSFRGFGRRDLNDDDDEDDLPGLTKIQRHYSSRIYNPFNRHFGPSADNSERGRHGPNSTTNSEPLRRHGDEDDVPQTVVVEQDAKFVDEKHEEGRVEKKKESTGPHTEEEIRRFTDKARLVALIIMLATLATAFIGLTIFIVTHPPPSRASSQQANFESLIMTLKIGARYDPVYNDLFQTTTSNLTALICSAVNQTLALSFSVGNMSIGACNALSYENGSIIATMEQRFVKSSGVDWTESELLYLELDVKATLTTHLNFYVGTILKLFHADNVILVNVRVGAGQQAVPLLVLPTHTNKTSSSVVT